MSTELGIALCALLSAVLLSFELGITKGDVEVLKTLIKHLEEEIRRLEEEDKQ